MATNPSISRTLHIRHRLVKRLALDGQMSALAVIESRLLAQQFFEHTDFFLQRL
jgi:hypothetical protein